MTRTNFLLTIAFLLMVHALPAHAATYYVGTCKVGAFGSINAAVAAVLAGSIVDVCPGTYAEQVIISKALTLQGISASDSSQPIITVPSGGLATTSSIGIGTTVAAQVEVTAGPVKITGITVDGTASSNCPACWYVGIFYSSGSSGTVNGVETSNQSCNGNGIGIIAENGAGAAQSVTIAKTDVNGFTYTGIWACSDQTPTTLTALIKGNNVKGGLNGVLTSCNDEYASTNAGSVSGNNIYFVSNIGVFANSVSSAISGNTITGQLGAPYGIYVLAPAAISGNTVNSATYGIAVAAPGSITSNHISNVGAGIYFAVAAASVKTNIITQAGIGIAFQCLSGTVSGNTINGASNGIYTVPAAFTGVNTFYNVATVRTGGGC
jgi:hypothetical protein